MRVARRGRRTRDGLVCSRAPIPVQPSGTCVARKSVLRIGRWSGRGLRLWLGSADARVLLVSEFRRSGAPHGMRVREPRGARLSFAKALPHDGQKYGAWYSCFECRGVYTGMFKKLMAKRWLDISVPTKTAYADVYFAAAENYGDALVEAGNWSEAVRFCTDLRSEMLAAVGPGDSRCQGATVNIARAMHGQGGPSGRQSRAGGSAEKLARVARSVASDARGRHREPGRGLSCTGGQRKGRKSSRARRTLSSCMW